MPRGLRKQTGLRRESDGRVNLNGCFSKLTRRRLFHGKNLYKTGRFKKGGGAIGKVLIRPILGCGVTLETGAAGYGERRWGGREGGCTGP